MWNLVLGTKQADATRTDVWVGRGRRVFVMALLTDATRADVWVGRVICITRAFLSSDATCTGVWVGSFG